MSAIAPRSARSTWSSPSARILPIIAMIQATNAQGAELHLLYGGRQRSSMAYLEKLIGRTPQLVLDI